jgi:hypothetical protein
MSEDHDTEEPAESSSTHEKSDKNGPPKNGPITLLFFGKVSASVRAVLAAIAQKSNMHSICEKIIKVIGIKVVNFTGLRTKEKEFL